MKKNLLSLLMAFVMAVAVWVPATSADASAATTITPRTSLPAYSSDIGLKYYYTNNNIYYKFNYGPNLVYLKSRRGYCRGNCTWYAYARAGEILGKTFNPAFCRNAGLWYSINKNGKYYPYGSTPKVGAIACYSNHVAVVEKIENGKVYVSESGWRIGAKPTDASQIYFHYGTPWYSKPMGYIYITDGTTVAATEPTYTTTAANYQVKITANNLNMRTGPGTSYESKGYVQAGTYTITAESNGWGKLSSNGYWVSLSYTTKLNDTTQTTTTQTSATTTKTTTAATTAVNYQIKVTAKDLNMRTGPGTSYTSKGHVATGTYTVTEEKSGWVKLSTNGYWVNLSYVTKVNGATTQTTTKATTTKATTTKATTATTKTTTATTTKAETTGAKFNVKITGSGLAMRTGAGTKYKKKGTVTKGKVYGIKAVKSGWGQLSSNGYWIKLSYTKLSGTSNIKITAKDLNMRTGAGTKYKSKGFVKTGSHKIKAMKNGWVQLSSNGYWVKMSYVKFV